MKTKPNARAIHFSGPMIRALLTKTQTRRIVKPQPPAEVAVRYAPIYCGPDVQNDPVPVLAWRPPGEFSVVKLRCPYGEPGDRLWVREVTSESSPCFLGGRAQPTVWYRADNNRPSWAEKRWTPAFLSPRRLSRITLEITDVRVERLQQISGNDVLAEGVDNGKANAAMGARWDNMQRMAFGELWEEIHGPGSWGANPWVWVVSFERVGI